MNRISKLISTLMTFCFIMNTACFDLAMAQTADSYNLSTPSVFDNLTGLQPQDMGRIEAILRLNFAKAKYRNALDVDHLIQIADQYRDSVYKTQIMFREPKDLPNGYVAVLCKTREGDLAHGAGRYYAVFQKEMKDAFSPIYIYTEAEFKRFKTSGAFTKEPPKREAGDEKDRVHAKNIARYVRQEMGIDQLIAFAHSHEAYKFGIRVLSSDTIGVNYSKIVNEILSLTKVTIDNSGNFTSVQARECYIIPVTRTVEAQLKECGIELEAVNGEKRTIIPYYHSSNNAVHVFLAEEDVNVLEASQGGRIGVAASDRAKEILEKVRDRLTHEVGVMLGMSILGFDSSTPYNEMDQRYRAAIFNVSLEPKQFVIIDLDQNLTTRDYVAGKTGTKMSKSEAKNITKEMISLQEELARLKHDLENCNLKLRKLAIRLRGRLAYQKAVYEWVLSDRVEDDIRYAIENAEARAERLRAKISSVGSSISSMNRKLKAAGLTVIVSSVLKESDNFGTGEMAILRRRLAKEKESLGNLALGLHRRLKYQNAVYEWVLFDRVEDRLNEKIEAKQKSIEKLERQIAVLQRKARTRPGKSPEDLLALIRSYIKTGAIISAPKLCDLYAAHYSEFDFEAPAKRESDLRTKERDLFEIDSSLLKTGLVKELPVKGPNGERQFVKVMPTTVAPVATTTQDEITSAITLASEAGLQIPTHPNERYNLLVTSDFFANGELEEHRAKYGDRFDLDRISGRSSEQLIDNILAKASGKETKTVALVPNDLPAEQLERLTKIGIRFVRVNTTDLQKAKTDKDTGREKFQIDTYAMMLLLRRIDNSITADSSMYRLLSFYLKSHFELTDKIAIDEYIMAIVNNDVARLIKGCLAYRPAQPYEAPNYNNVAASLISA